MPSPRPTQDSTATTAPRGRSLERAQWRQLLLITIGAIGIYVTLRLLPTGTNLNHMDFRAQGNNSIEFCDPLNPQFIPVIAARSPVTLTLSTVGTPTTGSPVQGAIMLRTSAGKPIGPEDLLIVHTQPLHLLIVDPSLHDYQHVHPVPTRTTGEWAFQFTPQSAGTYRVFADFTPVATRRGLYASADLEVVGGSGTPNVANPTETPAMNSERAVTRDGYVFRLVAAAEPLRARQPIDFAFTIASLHGDRVPLETVMGAYAHLVAFDTERSGFAHLHPTQADSLAAPDPIKPVLNFKLTIPTAGTYVIWSQVNLGGKEAFVPFWFKVVE